MQEYKAATGLNAVLQGNLLVVSWAGQDGAELRARYGVDGGSPVVRDLAVLGKEDSGRRSVRISSLSTTSSAAFGDSLGSRGNPLQGLGS